MKQEKMFIENKSNITYLRVILTNKCNLNCRGCHREGQICHAEMNSFDLIKIVSSCIRIGIRKIKLMGGEPALRSDLFYIIRNIKNVDQTIDLSLISNGTAEIENYYKCFDEGLDRLNISIHGFSLDTFLINTKSTELLWGRVRNNLNALCSKNRINKINYVLKRGVNEHDLLELILWLSKYPGVLLDVLNYLTTDYEEQHFTYGMGEIENFLEKNIGIESIEKVSNDFSLESTHITLKNGVTVNLKTSELRYANFLKSCAECKEKTFCTEGIAAVRLCTDYRIQPCLVRNDNCFSINPYCDNLEYALLEYFNNL